MIVLSQFESLLALCQVRGSVSCVVCDSDKLVYRLSQGQKSII